MWLLAHAAHALGAGDSPVWLYILGAILAGGTLDFAWRVYRRWRHGQVEDVLEIARAAKDQAENSSQLWERYRVELEDAKKQLANYLEKLVTVYRELGAANAKIMRLETDLNETRGDNQRLRAELVEARTRREELLRDLTLLQARVKVLEGVE